MWNKADKLLIKDKYLKSFVKKYGPCKIKKKGKKLYFEHLVSSIVEQQLSAKAATTIFTRVKIHLKKITPSSVLKAKDEDLRNCGMSWSKVTYVKNLAKKVEDKKIIFENIHKLSDEDIVKKLVKVKGIGAWTAEMFLMFTLARPDVFPVDDLGIQKGMQKLFKKKLNKKKMQEISERWAPYRTVASWYVWKAADN